MKFLRRLIGKLKGRGMLCDTCAFDYPAACYRPERPNARNCPDYQRRY